VRHAAVFLCAASLLAIGACQSGRVEPVNRVNAPPTPASSSPTAPADDDIFAGPRLEDIQPAERPHISTDEAGLWLIFDRLENRLKTAGNLVRDRRINDYVRGIACRVAGPYCRDIRVYIMRQPGFNATMAPNGMMTLWSGLLIRARNEAQLAAVIGHEISHYLRRHSVSRFRDIRRKSGFLTFLSMVMGAGGVGQFAEMARFALISSTYAHSRDDEREADRLGLRLMAEAGYDPREAAKTWDNLIGEFKNDQARKKRSIFFATHPQSSERRDALLRMAKKATESGRTGKVHGQRFHDAVAARRAVYLRDELRLGRHTSLETLYDMLAKEEFARGETHFFRGELYRLRKGKGDSEKAFAAYRDAIQTGVAPPEIHRSLALLHLKAGKPARAREEFRKYLELRPKAEDREMIRQMIGPTS